MDGGRSMRAVKNNLPTPSGKVEEFRRPLLNDAVKSSEGPRSGKV